MNNNTVDDNLFYIEQVLSPKEKVLINVKLSSAFSGVWLSLWGIPAFIFTLSLLIGGYLFCVFAIFFDIVFIAQFLAINTTCMFVTNKRIVYRTGFFTISTEELLNKKIESIEINQSFLGSIFNYGNIYFSGTGTSKVIFIAVDNVIEIKKEIEKILHQ